MADSDSDDELMSRLTSTLGGFGRLSGGSAEDCSYCGTPNAALACSICQEAYYCSEVRSISLSMWYGCSADGATDATIAPDARSADDRRASCAMPRRTARSASRVSGRCAPTTLVAPLLTLYLPVLLVLTARMQKEESESSEEESSEEESDSESEDVGQAPLAPTSARRSGAGAAALQIPGLTQQQIKKLLDLSAKAETMSAHKDIDTLQKQIAQLMADKTKSTETVRDRAASSSPPVNLREIRELQKKLQELEKKTQNMPLTPHAPGGGAVNYMPAGTKVYTPTLVKDDPAFRKYFKLLDMSMPVDQIRAKMETEGVNPALLETPDAVSPNDPGVRGCDVS